MGVGDDCYDIGFNYGDELSGTSCHLGTTSFTKTDYFFCSTNFDPIVSTMMSGNEFSDSPYSFLTMENQRMNSICHYPFGSSYVDMAPTLMSYGNSSNQISLPCIPNKEVEGAEAFAIPPIRIRAYPETESEFSMNLNKKDCPNSCGKQPAKENPWQDTSQSEGSPKEDYVLLRARKGQATKSHSLAERLRREKISERMKLLQELVPGCNKITGKAVMLDEIINYVQSLQQQVEFLSMKLATVTPEPNFDIQRFLSKDICHSRIGAAAPIGRFDSGTSLPQSYGIIQETLPRIPASNQQLIQLPQTVLDNELQGLYQAGFVYNPAFDSLASDGYSKPDL